MASPADAADRADTTLSAATRLWALLFGMGLLLVGNGLQSSLLGVRAEAESFGGFVTGLVMSGYFLGFFAGSLATPRFVRRVGHVRVFAALASLASIAILVHSVLVLPAVWALMRLLTGLAFAGLYIVSESWLNDSAPNRLRGSLLAVYMVISYLGLAGGQLMLNLAAPQQHTLFILCSILISLALVPILLSSTRQPAASTPDPMSLKRLYAVSPLGAVGCFGTGIANGVILGMGAVYARQTGLSVAEVSIFMTALVLGGAVLQWPIGKISDHADRRAVITGVAVLAALAALGVHLASWVSATAVLAMAGLMGGAVLSLYPLVLAYTNDHLDPRQMVAASSALVLAYGAGAVLGPSGAGWLMDLMGPKGFLFYLGLIHAAIAAFGAYRMTRRPSPTDQYPHILTPTQASPVSAAWTEESREAAEAEG